MANSAYVTITLKNGKSKKIDISKLKVYTPSEDALKGILKSLIHNCVTGEGSLNKKCLKAINSSRAFDTKSKANAPYETLQVYKQKAKNWQDTDAFTEDEIETKTEDAVERTIKNVLVQDNIESAKTDLKGQMCIKLPTEAEEPDPEHAQYDFEEMPCEDVLDLLSRYGCQCSYTVLTDDSADN